MIASKADWSKKSMAGARHSFMIDLIMAIFWLSSSPGSWASCSFARSKVNLHSWSLLASSLSASEESSSWFGLDASVVRKVDAPEFT